MTTMTVNLQRNKDLPVLSAFVHGALAAGHLLGIAYNLRRDNRLQAMIHGGAMVFDAWATIHHMKESNSGE